MPDPRYPIGPFTPVATPTPAQITGWIDELESFPAELRAAHAALPPGGLDQPYRDGGWTGRQVIHHLADSHVNLHCRVRLALTEDTPTIKPYDEVEWAKLPDVDAVPVEVSMALVEAVHTRLIPLLRALTPAQLARTYVHPADGVRTVATTVQLYAWHGKHHVGHLGLIR